MRKKATAAAQSSDEDGPSSSSRAPAVNRAIAILRILAHSPSPMTLNGIARELDIFPSTCFHVLHALEEEGFVVADPADKRYSIGLGLITLARGSLNGGIPTRLVKHELDAIATEFGVTSIASQLHTGDRVVVIAMSYGVSTFATHFDVGRRLPAYISATGRCLAAHSGLSRVELKKRFEDIVWGSAPSFSNWLEQVEEARETGVGIDINQHVPGYTILAAPIFERDRMTRSLASVAATGQLSEKRVAALKVALRDSAQRLSS